MTSADLFSPSSLGFVRAAVVSPELRVADVAFNTEAIVAALQAAAGQGCRLALFPELCLTGYSCADLFLSGGAAGPGARSAGVNRRPRRRPRTSRPWWGCRWRWTAGCTTAPR